MQYGSESALRPSLSAAFCSGSDDRFAGTLRDATAYGDATVFVARVVSAMLVSREVVDVDR